MRKPSRGTLLALISIFSVLGAAALSACAPPASSEPKAGLESKVAPAKALSRPASFAEALQAVDVSVDDDGKARLSFRYLDSDPSVAEADGSPAIVTVPELAGSLDENGRAHLSSAMSEGYEADLNCGESEGCNPARLVVTKEEGELRGRATVISKSMGSLSLLVQGHDTPADPDAPTLPFWQDLSSPGPGGPGGMLKRSVQATLGQIAESGRELVQIRVDFSNASLNSNDPEYFDRKAILLEGETGADRPIELTRQVSRDHHITQSAASVRGDVASADDPLKVSVQIGAPDASALSSIVVWAKPSR